MDYAVSGRGLNPADATDFGGTLPSGTVSFAAGESAKTISLAVSGDYSFESDEGFSVTLSNPTPGATITTASVDGTILNDDFRELTFTAIGSAVLSTSVSNGRLQVTIDSVIQADIDPALVGTLTINGGDANDTIVLAGLSKQLYPNLSRIVINGGGGDDTIRGSAWNETIRGGLGDDSVSGGGGVDCFTEAVTPSNSRAGVTINVAKTSLRTQFTVTGFGTDTISDFEELSLSGGAGNDRIDARRFRGNVTLQGNDGNDTLFGAAWDDRLDGGAGNDRLTGNGGTNQLNGGDGTDYVVESGATTFVLTPSMLTGNGSESLNSVERANLKTAETSSRIDATAFVGSTTLTGGAGNDTLLGGLGRDLLQGGAGNDLLHGGNGHDSLFGGAGDDMLVDPSGNNVMSGEDGNDTIIGGGGSSTLIGGNGNDLLFGGTGREIGLGGVGGPARGGSSQKDAGDFFIDVELIDETFAGIFAGEGL